MAILNSFAHAVAGRFLMKKELQSRSDFLQKKLCLFMRIIGKLRLLLAKVRTNMALKVIFIH